MDWDAFFEATLSLSRLKVIRGLWGKTLLYLQAEILVKALSKLERVDLHYTHITIHFQIGWHLLTHGINTKPSIFASRPLNRRVLKPVGGWELKVDEECTWILMN